MRGRSFQFLFEHLLAAEKALPTLEFSDLFYGGYSCNSKADQGGDAG
jgi:hypothetical protein